MPWKDYLKTRVVRKTFEELACPEFWVEFLSPDSMTYGEQKEMMHLVDDGHEATAEDAERVLARLVTAWNLTDPATDAPLPLPSQDLACLNVLPADFLIAINRWIGEASQANQMVPPPTGT